jgi:hypothetical protein
MQIVYRRQEKVLIMENKKARRQFWTFISLDLVPLTLPLHLLSIFGVSFTYISALSEIMMLG